MLDWDGNRWVDKGIIGVNLLLTIGGSASQAKFSNESFHWNLDCETVQDVFISCLNDTKEMHLFFDSSTGKLGWSSLFGAVAPELSNIGVQAFSCTKF